MYGRDLSHIQFIGKTSTGCRNTKQNKYFTINDKIVVSLI